MKRTSSNINNNKRKRAVNFTEFEVRMLIDVVLKYMHIVENKTSDAVTWKHKNDVWDDIAKEFNTLTGQINRAAKELRLKYECIKKKIKKKQSHNNFERFKTGGGVADIEIFTDYEEKILSHIALSVDGLEAEDDCDADYIDKTPKSVMKENHSQVKPTEITSVCLSNETVPLTPEISFHVIEESVNVECNNNLEEISLENVVVLNDIFPENKNSNNNLEGSTSEYTGDLKDVNNENKEHTNQTWAQWNSSQLKSAKHKALFKKTKSKPIQKETLNTKIANVTDSRQELLLLQISVSKNEEDRKAAEHSERLNNIYLEKKGLLAKNELFAKKDQLLELKIANEKLKQEMLRRQLQSFR